MEKEIVKANGALPIAVDDNLPTCSNCPCWSPRTDVVTAGNVPGGECRLNPPVNHLMPVHTLKGQEIGVQTFFPMTGAKQWCGKHPVRDSEIRANMLLDSLSIVSAENPGFAKLLRSAGLDSEQAPA